MLISGGQGVGFCPAQLALREMGVHLIPIKVSIVSLAVGVVQPQHLLPGQDAGTVGLDGGSVKGGLAVQQQHIPVLDVPAHLQERLGYCLRGIAMPQKGLIYL